MSQALEVTAEEMEIETYFEKRMEDLGRRLEALSRSMTSLSDELTDLRLEWAEAKGRVGSRAGIYGGGTAGLVVGGIEVVRWFI